MSSLLQFFAGKAKFISLTKHRDNPNKKNTLKDLCANPVTALILLALVCLVTYWRVVSLQFQTMWDDQWEVINYYTSSGLSPANLWAVLTEFYHGQYAPVNEYYYITLYTLFGYDPFWFHLGSLLIHIGNVMLAYMFVSRLLSKIGVVAIDSIGRIAFFTALLLAVHPMTVEVVAWISASKSLLYVFFYLSALHFYLSYTVTGKPWHLFFTAFAFVLSFGAKEQAVTLPVCLLLIDYALGRGFLNKKLWVEKFPFFLLSVFFGIITMYSQADTGEGVLSGEDHYPFYQNVLFASYSVVEYITKLLVPVKLSYLYPFPNIIGDSVPLRFWVYPFVIMALVVTLWTFWKQKWVFFGISFFFLHIA